MRIPSTIVRTRSPSEDQMTEIEKDLNLMLLKLCEELLPKTKVAEDDKFKTAMKKVRQYLEGGASATGHAK